MVRNILGEQSETGACVSAENAARRAKASRGRVWRIGIAAVFLFVLLWGSGADAARLTILHVNDTHGHAWPFNAAGAPDVGGFAPMATLVKAIRAEVEAAGGHVLFLHAGDINTGVPESDIQSAIPDIVALNMLGLDAVTLGNHEFDNARDTLYRQRRFARFPFLASNIVSGDEPPFDAPLIREFGDVTVAVYGLTTESTPIATDPENTKGLVFRNAVEVSRALVPVLAKSADVVVALTHLGWPVGAEDEGVTTSKALAEAKIPGLDVIVDGHSHTLFDDLQRVGDAIVVQAGAYGEYLGRLDLEVKQGRIVAATWKALPINVKKETGKDAAGKAVYGFVGDPVPADPDVATALDYFAEVGSEGLDRKVGETKVLLDGERDHVRSGETNLSHLLTDAMRWKTSASVAFLNGGGIRASIPEGDISYRSVLTVLPFGNTLYALDLSGEDLQRFLDSAAKVSAGKGGFPHFSGLTATFADGTARDVLVDGKPLDKAKQYRFVTLSFLANGGDGYSVLREIKDAVGRGYDTGYTDANVFVDYLSYLGVVEKTAEEPRIRR